MSWFYNWATDPQQIQAPAGVDFVPMIWGAGAVNANDLAKAKQSGNTLLGFNEPDLAGQANMTVDQALSLWPQLEATGMWLGAPAVAWGADQDGQWLDMFMAGAKDKGYRVDFIPLHWYGAARSPSPARRTARRADPPPRPAVSTARPPRHLLGAGPFHNPVTNPFGK